MSEFGGSRIFLNIPVAIARDKDLLKKPKSILLMGEIISMLNTTGKFFMSNGELSRRLDCDKATIGRYLSMLEEKELIVRENVYKNDGSKEIIGRKIQAGEALKHLSLFGGIEHPLRTDADTPSAPVRTPYPHGRAYPSASVRTKENIIREQYKRTEEKKYSASSDAHPSKTELIEKEFEELWKLYPKKKGKKQALNHYKAWRKKSVKNTKEFMLSRLKAYLNQIQNDRTPQQYILNGSTWFNGRFEDDYSTETNTRTNPSNWSSGVTDGLVSDDSFKDIKDDDLPF
ncbi:replication protein [Lactobacillus sp. PV037]|uniref:helix-turn-helix domain-containing protein n=1 Tax=Lactobacillus sp. PV037 TaxID=2594496 RepID=UPI00223F20E2|nr:helix-turn-helix domain-containing protein [Lactobacillus sp. PV037]QNQ83799.1 replication protein [Lactobacillus sp. PV037]